MRANIDISSTDFPSRLKALRARADLTKAELASRAGISYRSLHELEKGSRARAQEKTLRLLAGALGVSFEMLVSGADAVAPPKLAEAREPAKPPMRRARRRVGWRVAAALILAGCVVAGFALTAGHDRRTPENDLVPIFVTDFNNVVDPDDPDRLATIVAELVVNDLTQSRYLRVIVSPNIPAELVGRTDAARFEEDSAAISAVRVGAKWRVSGSILGVEPTLIITSRIENAMDGTVLAAQQVWAMDNETVFDAARRLAAVIKRDLVLPRGDRTEEGLPIARPTTTSITAYHYFAEGVENLRMLYRDRAREKLRLAVEADTNFAMAYVMLVHPDIVLSHEEGDSLMRMARLHSEGITLREMLYIEAFDAWNRGDIAGSIAALEDMVEAYPQESEAYRLLGRFYRYLYEPAKARAALEAAVQVDPFDGMSINRLAYLSASLGDTDEAFRLIDRYIALAPSQANPYDTRGDLLAWSGRVEEAMSSYETALQYNPRFSPSIQSLGVISTLTGRYDDAKRYFRMLFESEDPGTRFRARWLMAIVDVYQGHLIDARETLQEVAAADRLEGGEQAAGNGKLLLTALIEEEEGHIDRAIDIYRGVFEECRQDELEQWMERYVDLLARRNLDAASAFTDSVEALVEGKQSDGRRACWQSRGWLELRAGNPDKACTWFERAAEASDEMNYQYPLGLAYLRAHRAEDAARTFEGILNRYSASRLVRPTWSVKTYYYLGRAYEEAGRHRDAATDYKKFLELWENADPVFPELADARARFEMIASGE